MGGSFGVKLRLKCPITMTITTFLQHTSIVRIVDRRDSHRDYRYLDPSIKIIVWSVIFKLLFTWNINLLCIVLYIGMREVMMNSICGIFQWNIRLNCTIIYQIKSLGWLLLSTNEYQVWPLWYPTLINVGIKCFFLGTTNI